MIALGSGELNIAIIRPPWRRREHRLDRALGTASARSGTETEMRSLRLDAAIVVGFMLLCGAGSLWLGPDLNVDLQNYHFYNGYALVTGRPLGWDILPASVRTFFNPVMDAFHYWGIVHLPAKAFGFILGALHGLNPALVYLIARRLFREEPWIAPAIAAGLFATLGPAAFALLGTTTGDSLATIPILVALLLAVGVSGEGDHRARIVGAGVLAGLAVGLKLTMIPFAPIIGLALIVTALGLRAASAGTALFGTGGVAGYLFTGGFRSVQLWRLFGNPIFPFANSFFKSPYFPIIHWPTGYPQADTLWQHLSPPLDMALGNTSDLQEFFSFRDARWLVLLAVGVVAFVRRGTVAALRRDEKILLIFVAGGYLAWLKLLYYYRYLVPVELLVPVALFVVWRKALSGVAPRRIALGYLTLLAALVLFSRTDPRGLGRHTEWVNGWFDIRLPRLAAMPNAIVLTDLHISYVFPSFPASDRFCMLHHGGMEWANDQIAHAIAGHSGPVLYFPPIGSRQLAPLGLRETGVCEPLRTIRGQFRLCLAERGRE
jgi:hypothetical protein